MTLSRHIWAEIDHTAGTGRPLAPGERVPGCPAGCWTCVVGTLGMDEESRVVAEQIIRELSRVIPAERRLAADKCIALAIAYGLHLPSTGVLIELASRVRGARRAVPTRTADPLPIEAARTSNILDVAKRHGISLRRVGTSWRGPCPLHGGEGMNFSVSPKLGLFNCFVCGQGGDSISLEQALSGVDFPTAVRALAS